MGWMEIAFGLVGTAFGFGLCWMMFSARLPQIHAIKKELEDIRRERTALHERAVTAEAEKRGVEARLLEQKEQLQLEFKNMSNTLLENITQKFSKQSEKQIGDLLNPLRERITDFQKLVVDSFGAQGKEQHTLKSEIEKIVLQTDSLTKALRGDSKAQGNWGEVMLEKILEESGLRRGVDYVAQAVDMSLRSSDGGVQKPDVVVHLPDGKHVIIDSKVSLTAYDRYCGDAQETHLREFLKSLRAHVVGLSGKKYQENEKLQTPDFVFMFLPIEGAYALAVQQDRELHSYAWDKKVVIVCPSTLFASLRTIASLWQIEQSNRNAQEIARQGATLYDKFYGFLEDMSDIDKQMKRMQGSYDAAMNKLSTGRGNLVDSAEKLKQLGVKPGKNLRKIAKVEGEESENIMQLAAGDIGEA